MWLRRIRKEDWSAAWKAATISKHWQSVPRHTSKNCCTVPRKHTVKPQESLRSSWGLCFVEVLRMTDRNPVDITLEMMRQVFYSAVVCDALDAEGLLHQSPRVAIKPMTVPQVLIGRCKTTLWADMAH